MTVETESGSVGAPAAGLARVVADAFMLRSQVEMALWRVGGASADTREVLGRLRLFLDEFIQAMVMRIQILGGNPPGSFAELRALCSVAEPGDGALPLQIAVLAGECGTLREGCRMIAMLARECSDDTTSDILSPPVAALEEASWRLAGLSNRLSPLRPSRPAQRS